MRLCRVLSELCLRALPPAPQQPLLGEAWLWAQRLLPQQCLGVPRDGESAWGIDGELQVAEGSKQIPNSRTSLVSLGEASSLSAVVAGSFLFSVAVLSLLGGIWGASPLAVL